MKRCNICQRRIWWWNKFSNRIGGGIIIDKRHPEFMLTHYLCSEKCFKEYSWRHLKWIQRIGTEEEIKECLKNFKKEYPL